MHIEATATFVKLYQKLPLEMQDRVKKALALLEENLSHPSLGHKKMSGQTDIYEFRVSRNYRVTYQKINEVAYLRKVGTHDLLRDP